MICPWCETEQDDLDADDFCRECRPTEPDPDNERDARKEVGAW